MAETHHPTRDDDNDDNDDTQQHLVNQVLKTLWPGHKSCRYSACPNGMVEVDCPDSATVLPVGAVTKLHEAGLQPIVYLSRGCVAVAGPDHVPDAEARRQRGATKSGTTGSRKRKRDADDEDDADASASANSSTPITSLSSSRMAALLQDLSALDGYACPTVTATAKTSFCVQGLGSVVHGDVLRAVERWNGGEPQPAPAVPKMVYDFGMCQMRVMGV